MPLTGVTMATGHLSWLHKILKIFYSLSSLRLKIFILLIVIWYILYITHSHPPCFFELARNFLIYIILHNGIYFYRRRAKLRKNYERTITTTFFFCNIRWNVILGCNFFCCQHLQYNCVNCTHHTVTRSLMGLAIAIDGNLPLIYGRVLQFRCFWIEQHLIMQ